MHLFVLSASPEAYSSYIFSLDFVMYDLKSTFLFLLPSLHFSPKIQFSASHDLAKNKSWQQQRERDWSVQQNSSR